jgi:adenylate cyclase
MLQTIERVNVQRAERNEPPFVTGIGIHTGLLTAGGLGTADRLHYTIIGDTVNTTQRLEDLTHQYGNSSAVISHDTLTALGDRQDEFHIEPLGEYVFRGKSEQLLVYRLLP